MRASLIVAIVASVVAFSASVEAQASIKRVTAIPPQELAPALKTLVQEREFQLIYSSELLADRKTQGASGEFTMDEALAKLLSGTGLTYQYVDEKTVSIVPMGTQPAKSEKSAVKKADATANYQGQESDGVHQKSFWDRFRVAQVDQGKTTSDGELGKSERASEDNSGENLEEILVTATKRAESIQAVPLSISVLSNEEIDRKGIVGMSDYLRTLPGVSQIDLGAARNSIIMRGVTSDPQNDPSGQTVGYYLNDIPLTGYTFRGGADIKLVDLQRVEVIRGPQGTLYGSASLGGAVRNVPNPPNLEQFEGYVKAGYSYTDGAGSENSSIEGVLNLPIVAGKFAVRAVGYRFENSGYVENIAGSDPFTVATATTFGVADLAIDQKEVGSDEYIGARVAALFQPIDSLKVTLSYLTQDITQDGLPEVELIRAGKFEQSRLQLGDLVGGGVRS